MGYKPFCVHQLVGIVEMPELDIIEFNWNYLQMEEEQEERGLEEYDGF